MGANGSRLDEDVLAIDEALKQEQMMQGEETKSLLQQDKTTLDDIHDTDDSRDATSEDETLVDSSRPDSAMASDANKPVDAPANGSDLASQDFLPPPAVDDAQVPQLVTDRAVKVTSFLQPIKEEVEDGNSTQDRENIDRTTSSAATVDSDTDDDFRSVSSSSNISMNVHASKSISFDTDRSSLSQSARDGSDAATLAYDDEYVDARKFDHQGVRMFGKSPINPQQSTSKAAKNEQNMQSADVASSPHLLDINSLHLDEIRDGDSMEIDDEVTQSSRKQPLRYSVDMLKQMQTAQIRHGEESTLPIGAQFANVKPTPTTVRRNNKAQPQPPNAIMQREQKELRLANEEINFLTIKLAAAKGKLAALIANPTLAPIQDSFFVASPSPVQKELTDDCEEPDQPRTVDHETVAKLRIELAKGKQKIAALRENAVSGEEKSQKQAIEIRKLQEQLANATQTHIVSNNFPALDGEPLALVTSGPSTTTSQSFAQHKKIDQVELSTISHESKSYLGMNVRKLPVPHLKAVQDAIMWELERRGGSPVGDTGNPTSDSLLQEQTEPGKEKTRLRSVLNDSVSAAPSIPASGASENVLGARQIAVQLSVELNRDSPIAKDSSARQPGTASENASSQLDGAEFRVTDRISDVMKQQMKAMAIQHDAINRRLTQLVAENVNLQTQVQTLTEKCTKQAAAGSSSSTGMQAEVDRPSSIVLDLGTALNGKKSDVQDLAKAQIILQDSLDTSEEQNKALKTQIKDLIEERNLLKKQPVSMTLAPTTELAQAKRAITKQKLNVADLLRKNIGLEETIIGLEEKLTVERQKTGKLGNVVGQLRRQIQQLDGAEGKLLQERQQNGRLGNEIHRLRTLVNLHRSMSQELHGKVEVFMHSGGKLGQRMAELYAIMLEYNLD
ncbi:hypothetical protein EJ08DRAFT_695975 [Tothia fuscella]|uniref:Uncharacterized protein n=1 Tax=Tothia fuscella TaxID=1048955 RepID=A0A9P4NU95_9PEZI|nr:hypothetical protein EJ08DRAFT_695975 [Tothia fuscella]